MRFQQFACGPIRDKATIIEALERRGCTVIVKPVPCLPGYDIVTVYLPDNEHQEKCRAIIGGWRIIAATNGP